MKENKYDDAAFFAAYSQFLRSREGLDAAGEWPALKRMLPDLSGKRVLDLGCGYGWHCIYAAQQGASYVLGTDISEKMLAVARQKANHPGIELRRVAMEDIDPAPGSFDVVLSSLALHYTPDFGAVCRRMARALSPGGHFVFSVEHPIFTAQGPQDWVYGDDGQPAHWPVDDYFLEGRRDSVFLGSAVVKYHRTLATYLTALLQAGLTLTSVVEPQPEGPLRQDPAMRHELRRPMMLLVSAQKSA